MNKILSLVLITSVFMSINAQDNLINVVSGNKSDSAVKKFKFTPILDIEKTEVKSQGKSGTCWSYSTSSFLESEVLRMKKIKVDLADIYPVRCAYIDKAETYVRLHGGLSWGDGGAFHDVINMTEKYGALPQSVYSGIQYESKLNNFGEMQSILESYLKGVVSNKSGKLSPVWKKSYANIIEGYLGVPPTEFEYEGKKYTPKTFSSDYLGLNPKDYVEISSFTNVPYYTQNILYVPDNWSFDKVWNVQMNELTDIIDNALNKGYSVAWAADVSEKGFSWVNGVAYIPEKDYDDMTADEKKTMFDGPKLEKEITAEMRQKSFDNFETTDDHGMHIVGLYKDQNGKEYYMVKNSWGDKNDQKGFLYVTKNYVKYKSTAILLHKDGVPSTIKKKLNGL